MESRYRTIHCKMWGDEWFLALTQPQPCGAWLWIWLLTGELTDVVPGLIRSGELGMAEALAHLHGYVLPADPLDLAVEIAGRDDRLSVLLSLGAGRLYQMRYKGGRAHDSPSRRNHARV